MGVLKSLHRAGVLGPHPVRAVVVEGFTTRLAFGVVIFAMPLYARQLGMSLTEIGALVAMKALVEPAVKPFMGRAVDRWGARRGYLTAVTVRLVASVLLFTATTPASLYATRLVQGAASAARDPASISVMADSGERRLGRAFSLSFGAKDLGAVSAGALGGLLLAGSGNDFRLLWAFVAAISLVPVVVVWLWVPPPERKPPDSVPAGPAAKSGDPTAVESPGGHSLKDRNPAGSRLFADRRLRLLCALGLLAGVTAHMTHGLFPILAAEVAGLTPGQIGAIYSASVFVLLLVGPLAGLAADRFGAAPLTGARGIANALSSVLYLAFPTAAGMLSGRLVDDAGKAAFRPPWGSLLAQAARGAGPRGGRVAAGLDTALSVGEAAGPVIAAMLWDVWGLAVFLLVRAALGIATELLVTRRLVHTAPARAERIRP
ncbi:MULTISPECIES: MFS transporter [unclassified Streptomyces]|uniref:MFS transporter n=1 Tax=unclassified Streptomyces TaxID=2593676 RepID=UPI002E7628B0|nr:MULTISPECIES: MFS transporter [unclassified Streptomyces]MEE1763344.1 MFS transporter [Streptomyces sp. SP18BB07]MEE1831882.1 MFS transporter [Streptomyces sp. SP17KL33]